MGRAPRTKETLPDFLKWRRVTRPPLVFRGLTGSQRTPGFWGVTFIFHIPCSIKIYITNRIDLHRKNSKEYNYFRKLIIQDLLKNIKSKIENDISIFITN